MGVVRRIGGSDRPRRFDCPPRSWRRVRKFGWISRYVQLAGGVPHPSPHDRSEITMQNIRELLQAAEDRLETA